MTTLHRGASSASYPAPFEVQQVKFERIWYCSLGAMEIMYNSSESILNFCSKRTERPPTSMIRFPSRQVFYSPSIQYKSLRVLGLRWIFEALSGGDLSAIDPLWFYTHHGTEEKPEVTMSVLEAELKDVIETLQSKKHVIVGHNLFTDLGFLYKTFVGKLPEEVTKFQKNVHQLFPIVIDTKYLATHGADSMNPRSNLKEILLPFQKIHKPLILLDEGHNAYGALVGKNHEAGYDSSYGSLSNMILTNHLQVG